MSFRLFTSQTTSLQMPNFWQKALHPISDSFSYIKFLYPRNSTDIEAEAYAKALAKNLRHHRVGGKFWLPDINLNNRAHLVLLPPSLKKARLFWEKTHNSHPVPLCEWRVLFPARKHIKNPRKWNEFAQELSQTDIDVIKNPINPHALLEASEEIWCTKINELAILANIWERPVHLLKKNNFNIVPPTSLYALLGAEKLFQRPHENRPISALDAVETLILAKERLNFNDQISCCLGMSWWKRRRIAEFFRHRDGKPPRFFNRKKTALRYAKHQGGALAVWASKLTATLEKEASLAGVKLLRVEDGFIRSLGLGSGFLPPCSIIVDSRGQYVDPSRPSDLEHLLATTQVSPALHKRAQTLMSKLIDKHISKYAAGHLQHNSFTRPENKVVILVPGQVAGDLSVKLGGGRITDNFALLKEVRQHNPNAYIIYRPHPDVEAGHRPGAIPDKSVLNYADLVHRGGSMSVLLENIDEVHTLTSLTGFEALLRGRKVTTYGAPFYAGWGLTTHFGPDLPRRGRTLSLAELVAITLILYPLYAEPRSGLPCSPEQLIDYLGNPTLWRPSFVMRLRYAQGRLRRCITQYISSQAIPAFLNLFQRKNHSRD
ncbi:hypothetical protein GT348_01525 [Aristophania vespae]|uniref:Capsular polysaccharide biosynthesis protein n=1 Tax=Aristophania vespae TaxID=2697033 RepID=A0A6P1NJV1_9PROT|nr:hypothetical protein [Aristophania vespae]QHI95141.1 hypothetical protein GT348_01525 [Aristophania vespae]